MNTKFCSSLIFSVLGIALTASAADWPNWRGPNHNGISTESGWTSTWPGEGPRQVWKASVGTGFSSVTVSQGRVYTTGNKDDVDTVYCFDAETGKEIWKHSYECPLDAKFFEGGTADTPTVDGKCVYTISRRGHLFCLAADDGKVIWKTNVVDDLKLPAPTWGIAGSAYIDKDLAVFNVGSAGAAFDKATGALKWKSEGKAPGYSTPLPCQFGGKSAVAFFSMKNVVAVDPATGDTLWTYPWATRYDVSASDPVVVGDKVFISSGYDHGAALLQIKEGKPELVWQNKDMRNHINSSVLLDKCLYGFDGDAGDKGKLKCIELATGNLKWSQEGLGTGSLMMADGKLIILSSTGELVIAEPSPEAFKSIAKAKILNEKCWTVPVLANGKIFCRGAKGTLVCLDVKAK